MGGHAKHYTVLTVTARVLELLPLSMTALIPVVLLPMMGIVSTEQISQYYMKVAV